MPQTAHRQTSVIVGKSLITAEAVAQELRQRLVEALTQHPSLGTNQADLLDLARNILRDFEPILAENLQAADLAAWIAGYDVVARQLPPWALDLFRSGQRPPRPPWIKIPGLLGDDGGDGALRFPLIENAFQSLWDRQILTRPQFDLLDSEARARAFTVAYQDSEDTIEAIRDVLAEDLEQGTSLRGFAKSLDEALGGSPIGPAHLETVYRTNVQAAFRDGRESLANHPIVADLFPYQEYIPIHDGRVRPEHDALGHLGLNGTGVYRRDDPVWDLFTPPWDYNCRCAVNLLTISKAASKGVAEARRWLDTGEPPEVPEHRLEHIKFRPPEGFGFRGRTTVQRMAQRTFWDAPERQKQLFDKREHLPTADPNKKKDSNPWQPYTGPRGGRGWKHAGTGRVVYQHERPGAEDEIKEVSHPDRRRVHMIEQAGRKKVGPETLADRRRRSVMEGLQADQTIGPVRAAAVASLVHGHDLDQEELAKRLSSTFGQDAKESRRLAGLAIDALEAWHAKEGFGTPKITRIKPEPETTEERAAAAKEEVERVHNESRKRAAETREWAEKHLGEKMEPHSVTRKQWAALHFVKIVKQSEIDVQKLEQLEKEYESDNPDVHRKAIAKMDSSHWKAIFKKYRYSYDKRGNGNLWEALQVSRGQLQSALDHLTEGHYDTWDENCPTKVHKQRVKEAVQAGIEVPDDVLDDYWYEDWVPAELRESRHTRQQIREFREYRDGEKHDYHDKQLMAALDQADKHLRPMISRALQTMVKRIDYEVPEDIKKGRTEYESDGQRLSAIAKESGKAGWFACEDADVKPELLDEWKALRAKRADFTVRDAKERKRKLALERQAKHDWLAEVVGETGGGKIDITGHEVLEQEGQDNTDEAVAFLQRFIHADVGNIAVHIKTLPPGSLRANANADTITLVPNESTWTIVHEIGHVLDHQQNNELGILSKTYAIERLKAAGVEPEHPGPPYESYEVMHKDTMRDRYCGKWYAYDASELFSMGLQYMYQDPRAFFDEDEDHFRYTLAAMRGLLT